MQFPIRSWPKDDDPSFIGDQHDNVGDDVSDGDGDDNVDDDAGNELAHPAASRVIIMIQSKMILLPSPLNSKEPCCQVHSTL